MKNILQVLIRFFKPKKIADIPENTFIKSILPMKKEIHDEVSIATEIWHDIILKTARYIKMNPNLVSIMDMDLCEEELRYLSQIPSNTLLSMSGNVVFGVDKEQRLKILDFQSGNLMEYIKVTNINNRYCQDKQVKSTCQQSERILTSWFHYIVQGFNRYLPLNTCALITESKEEHEVLSKICNQVGLQIVCEDLSKVRKRNGSIYIGKTKIDILVRTLGFYELSKNRSVIKNLLEAMYEKNLVSINPLEEYLTTSRAIQAVAWYLYSNNYLYTLEEQSFIRKYMVPTTLKSDPRKDEYHLPYFEDNRSNAKIYQERGEMSTYIRSFLIGNKFVGCIHQNEENKYEYSFISSK